MISTEYSPMTCAPRIYRRRRSTISLQNPSGWASTTGRSKSSYCTTATAQSYCWRASASVNPTLAYSGSGNDRHVLLLEGIGQCHRDILIFLGKKPRGKLEQVHLAAEILEDRRQLAAGGCSTNNRYARGQLLE